MWITLKNKENREKSGFFLDLSSFFDIIEMVFFECRGGGQI